MSRKKTAFQKVLCSALSLLLMAGVLAAVPAGATEGTGGGSSGSGQPTPEPTATQRPDIDQGGSPVITAYTVQDASGKELQRIEEGQKCQIVVAIADSRFTTLAGLQTDGKLTADFANAKITSTGSFATPSLGDIRFTTPKDDGGVVRYAVVFNDITYLGGENKLSFDLSYKNQKVSLVNLTQAISQCAGASSTEGGKSSALVVKSASYGASEVQAGKEFDLTAEILATAGTNAIDMVQVSLELPEKITVVSGNNNYYVGKLTAEASTAVTFRLLASAVTEPGSYNISVNVSGIGNDGTPVNNSLKVTVPVVQPERFEITNMEAYSPLFTGEEGTVSVTYVNKGKGIIYNLSAKIEGEGMDNEGQNQYLGNVAAGTEGSADFTISSQNAGTINGKVILTYEDEKGQEKTLEKEFSVEVQQNDMGGMDPGIMDPGMMDPTMGQPTGGMPWWGWVLIAVGAVVVVVVIVVIVKKQKAKKQRLEDEDEDI